MMNLNRHMVWRSSRDLSGSLRQVFDRFEQDANRVRQPAASNWMPRVDIREDASQFVITADIPGVDPSSINVSMDKGVLSIKGERKPSIEAGEGSSYSRVERAQGEFHRHFFLPDSADAESITANGQFGVLEIVIPKKAQPSPRRITINSSH